jgi:hypothetical protein
MGEQKPVTERPEVAEEALVYAKVLSVGARVALVVLVVTFAIYLFHECDRCVGWRELPRYWGQPAEEFAAETGMEPGWSWVGKLGCGHHLTYVGVAMLGLVSMVAYLCALPVFWKRREWFYVVVALAEVGVLLVAASGLVGVGH